MEEPILLAYTQRWRQRLSALNAVEVPALDDLRPVAREMAGNYLTMDLRQRAATVDMVQEHRQVARRWPRLIIERLEEGLAEDDPHQFDLALALIALFDLPAAGPGFLSQMIPMRQEMKSRGVDVAQLFDRAVKIAVPHDVSPGALGPVPEGAHGLFLALGSSWDRAPEPPPPLTPSEIDSLFERWSIEFDDIESGCWDPPGRVAPIVSEIDSRLDELDGSRRDRLVELINARPAVREAFLTVRSVIERSRHVGGEERLLATLRAVLD
ncbi:hypothetical protein GCM10010988_04920 [Cnuibacter physcomitrellae]|uniref:Uncharacterized protein n=1 Tax=Cnuibacter physcomitrellae TaxID=1619308 RepID=A0A1X9LJU7_9MICO|nr:hypothetical protein [Cnuibacter physcomitrellae]ARJ05407.1 hypothetical protein B5808_09380 [Cnuibacter physcomitrellae]GGI35637.1 hypothetical protein GCM10010988_04920 [Cnuibacter physcomitrellae]